VAKINFIVPPFVKNRFSGGILCALEYAHGLHQRGHAVNVIPYLPSSTPEWFPKPIGNMITTSRKHRVSRAVRSSLKVGQSVVARGLKRSKAGLRTAFANSLISVPELLPTSVSLGLADWYLPQAAPEADINIAFSFESARATSLLSGQKYYFLQHFDPYFKAEYQEPDFAEAVARHSYNLGLKLIANSSWLRRRITEELPGAQVALCPNAIDHSIYKEGPRNARRDNHVILISYGGRDAVWKGFREMAEAVAILRKRLVDYRIEWRVFGTALLQPENEIANYTPLGFLAPLQLAEEYRKADILLSASWYESFPLFPIEAMACGLPVITTQSGTEEYAIPRETAQIVEPKNPEGIAAGIEELISNPSYRIQLAKAGNLFSKQFTWERSVLQMESIILDSIRGSFGVAAAGDAVN